MSITSFAGSSQRNRPTEPSPFAKVPNEILAHILAFYTNTTPYTPFTNGLGPSLVLAVCKRWRQVAVENWFCWETIIIDTTKSQFPLFRYKLYWETITSRLAISLTAHMDRARGRKLDFLFRGCDRSRVFPKLQFSDAGHYCQMTTLIQEFTAQFIMTSKLRSFSGATLLHSNQCQYPHLTHLRDYWNTDRSNEFPVLKKAVFRFSNSIALSRMSCPNLRSLGLVFFLDQVNRPADTNIFEIIRSFPLLEELTSAKWIVVQKSGPPHNGVKQVRLLETSFPPVTAQGPRLPLGSVQHFLTHFPNIISFGSESRDVMLNLLSGINGPANQPIPRVIFQQLRLEGAVDLPYDLPPSSPVSRIKNLRLIGQYVNSDFEIESTPLPPFAIKKILNMLAERCEFEPDVPMYWPKLEHLEIFGIGFTRSALEALMQALRLRWKEHQTPKVHSGLNPKIGRLGDMAPSCLLTLEECWLKATHGEERIPLSNGIGMPYAHAHETIERILVQEG